MKIKIEIYNDRNLIVVNSEGELNLELFKTIARKIIEDPAHQDNSRILLDLRNAKLNMSVLDIYTLSSYITSNNPVFLNGNEVAVLVNDDEALNSMQFLETCSFNRGLIIRSFTDYEEAGHWLEVELPEKAEYHHSHIK